MQIDPKFENKLREEIRVGLQGALANAGDIRATLADRRQERLIERYSELALLERDFFDVVQVPVDWGNIKPMISWCDDKKLRGIWDYARNIVSSMPENSVIGRQMRYLFTDANSGRLLGIVCLASALTGPSPRHQRLQWEQEIKWKNLHQVMNIAVCVPVQPFGILCGGKLLFVSALSNEVRDEYRNRYGSYLLVVETTSLYGKSSQYNRVKEYEYLGLTKGTATMQISDALWEKIQAYLFLHPEHDDSPSKESKSNVKARRIARAASALGIDLNNTVSQQRGYYWGVTATNSEAILTNTTTDPPDFYDRPLDNLVDSWYKRWYLMRLPKKRDEVESFDIEQYRLDNNIVGRGDALVRQQHLF